MVDRELLHPFSFVSQFDIAVAAAVLFHHPTAPFSAATHWLLLAAVPLLAAEFDKVGFSTSVCDAYSMIDRIQCGGVGKIRRKPFFRRSNADAFVP